MMTPPLRASLESIYLQRQVDRMEGQLPPWIFCSQEGTPVDGANLRGRSWKPQRCRSSGCMICGGPRCPSYSMKGSRPGKSRATSDIGLWWWRAIPTGIAAQGRAVWKRPWPSFYRWAQA